MDRSSLVHTLISLGVKIDHQQSSKVKVVAYCPFAKYKHKNRIDTRPSFAAFVNDKGISGFLCMACRQKGTIHSLVSKLSYLTGNDFSDIMDEVGLHEEYGLTHFPPYEELVSIDEESLKLTPLDDSLYHGVYMPAYSHPSAVDYLQSRGISEQTSVKIDLQYDDDPDELRVLFPVRGVSGELYGFSGRSIIPDVPLKIKDYAGLPKKSVILGSHLWRKGLPVLIVEGLFGYASLIEQGVDSIANVGAIMGSVLTEDKANIIIDYDEPVYLMLDNDAGGELGTFGTGENDDYGAAGMLIGHVPLFIPAWPEGKSDPDELSFDDVKSVIANTDPFTETSLHPEEVEH